MMGVDPKKKKERPKSFGFSAGRAELPTSGVPTNSASTPTWSTTGCCSRPTTSSWARCKICWSKLGEIPAKGGNADTTRIIDSGSPEETQELLERIRRAWPDIAPNPLSLPAPGPAKSKTEQVPPRPIPQEAAPAAPSKTADNPPAGTSLQLTDLRYDAAADEAVRIPAEGAAAPAVAAGRSNPAKSETPPVDAANSPPQVKLLIGPDGKLIISSQDTQALDQLEEMAAQLAPPRKDYHVYHLKFASPIGLAMNLEDYFKEEKKKKHHSFWDFYYSSNNQDESDNDMRLSTRRKLKFIADTESNTILVTGGDSSQLRTVEEPDQSL